MRVPAGEKSQSWTADHSSVRHVMLPSCGFYGERQMNSTFGLKVPTLVFHNPGMEICWIFVTSREKFANILG